jgi:hypothetical protein
MREGARISEKGFKAHSVKLEPIENLKEQVREVSRAVCGAYQKSY